MFRSRRRASNKPRYFSTCYDWRGNLRWVADYLTGPDLKYRGLTEFGPRTLELRQIVPRLQIAFLGDVMCLKGRPYNIGPGLREFLNDVDFLVVNLEGLPSDQGPHVVLGQHQPRSFFRHWAREIFPAERTAWSVANNHAEDFGLDTLMRESTWLQDHGFQVFGTIGRPAARFNECIQVTGATAWNNQCGHGVLQLRNHADGLAAKATDSGLDILFVHWGREFQIYPPTAQINEAGHLATRWDAVVGHHSHCPQPVQVVEGIGRRTLIAYSLGNFCTWRPRAILRYGMALKLTCGPDMKGAWAIGTADWAFTYISCSGRFFNIGLAPSCALIPDTRA